MKSERLRPMRSFLENDIVNRQYIHYPIFTLFVQLIAPMSHKKLILVVYFGAYFFKNFVKSSDSLISLKKAEFSRKISEQLK